jgi:ABC-type branched-subunit amino acid transport system ATPase component
MSSFGQGLLFSLTGYSSTFKSIIGIATPRDGQVLCRGDGIAGTSPGHAGQRGIGLVPQGCGLAAGRTVEENLSLGGLARSGGGGLAWDRERIYSYFPRIRDKLTVKAD